MKNRFPKILSAICVLLVLVLCASVLFACDTKAAKRRKAAELDRKTRAQAVETVENCVLAAIDENWIVGLSSESIAELDKPEDYIVSVGFTKMAGDVLISSEVQTAKLTALAEYMLSEDGKNLLGDFEKNAELLISLLKSVDFTPTDISNLAYDLLCALVTESGAAFNKIIGDLQTAAEYADAAKKGRLSARMMDMRDARDDLVPIESEREELLQAFADAKQPIGELISFAYNMSVSAITDNMFNALFGGDGAFMSGVTNSEIVTLVNAVRENILDLKSVLAEENAVNNLDKAFQLILAKFDVSVVPSAIYKQILEYTEYAYMLVDVLPLLCDTLYAAGGAFADEGLIEGLKEIAASDGEYNDNAKKANGAIIVARVMKATLDALSADAIIDSMQGVAEKNVSEEAVGSYKKAVPFMLVDILLNLTDFSGRIDKDELEDKLTPSHPDILGEDDFKLMGDTIFLTLGDSLDKFHQKYDDYKANKAELGEVRDAAAACSFDTFGIKNPYSVNREFEKWYSYYVSMEREIDKVVAACNQRAIEDISMFVADYYAKDSALKAALNDFAKKQFFAADMSDGALEALKNEVNNGGMLGIISLILGVEFS